VNRVRLALLGGWSLLGILDASTTYVSIRVRDVPYDWRDAVLYGVLWWYLWGALTPLVAWVSRREPGVPTWPRFVLRHLGAGLVCASLHIAAFGTVIYYTTTRGSPTGGSLVGQVGLLLGGYLPADVLTYGAIAGVVYALAFYRRYRLQELEATRARLQALERELQPHFLFNALNVISGLVAGQRPDEAVDMLAGLGDLLRQTVGRGDRHELSLDEELRLCDKYLSIEQRRFPDRLRIEAVIDPGTAGAAVPALILQPLVENAIRHGVDRRTGASRITIMAVRNGARLSLAVRDEPVDPSNAGAVSSAPAAGHGVGLSNTRERLRALYGDGASLAFTSGDQGTSATLVLPYREIDDRTPPDDPPDPPRGYAVGRPGASRGPRV
jgi:two-component sensor histidine kinase